MGSARWFRLGIGLLLVVVPTWALLSGLDPIWAGHPAYPATLLVAIGAGLTLIAFVFLPWRLEPEPNGPPWEVDDQPTRAPDRLWRRGWRMTGRVLTAVLVIALVGFLAWLRPFPAAQQAIAAMRGDAAGTVLDNPTTIELRPVTPAAPTPGLVFSPGARVDPRAYVELLLPAAAAGYLVIILKEPY